MPTPLLFSCSSENFSLRVLVIDGQPWFVASDVCDALTIEDKTRALTRLDASEKDTSAIDTPQGRQWMTMVNESGLYCLIFSREKTKAKRFKKWVTSTVLPVVRNVRMTTIAVSQLF